MYVPSADSVLDGALSSVKALYGVRLFHQDIKPDSILVDFGLHMTTSASSDGYGLGNGTSEYSAPETELQG